MAGDRGSNAPRSMAETESAKEEDRSHRMLGHAAFETMEAYM